MPDRLKDRVALVIGAGSRGPGWGNGKAAAVLYAREGARVFAVDINETAADETRDIIVSEGGACAVGVADVTDAASVERIVQECIRAYGRIDILHNNQGIAELGGPVETPLENFQHVMDVNLTSMFLTCKYVLPIMEHQKRGVIINISSVASIRWSGTPYIGYFASKAAVNHFTTAVALQYATKGIRANTILPGLMNTPMIHDALGKREPDLAAALRKRDAACPMGHMGDAWDVAQAALFLASDDAKYITGVLLPVDGGISCKG